jgi:hypothetical protein
VLFDRIRYNGIIHHDRQGRAVPRLAAAPAWAPQSSCFGRACSLSEGIRASACYRRAHG